MTFPHVLDFSGLVLYDFFFSTNFSPITSFKAFCFKLIRVFSICHVLVTLFDKRCDIWTSNILHCITDTMPTHVIQVKKCISTIKITQFKSTMY